MARFDITLLAPDRYKTTRWSGGSTTQLLICPPEAQYADRDFLWRISSAVVEDEDSTFTPLPDYRRFISTLEGSIVLQHDGGELIPLSPFQVHAFDGGAETISKGRCRDFNLMLRKGKTDGLLKAVSLSAGDTLSFRAAEDSEELLLYCAEGSCFAELDGQTFGLQKNEAAVLRRVSDDPRTEAPAAVITFTAPGGSRLMVAQMQKCG